MKNSSSTITAEVEVPPNHAEGVILCQGGRFGGWSLYTKGGKVKFCYNWVGLARYTIAADKPLPVGRATMWYEFAFDCGRPVAGGKGTLYVNGEKVAEGRIEHTNAFLSSGDFKLDATDRKQLHRARAAINAAE